MGWGQQGEETGRPGQGAKPICAHGRGRCRISIPGILPSLGCVPHLDNKGWERLAPQSSPGQAFTNIIFSGVSS